MTDSSNLDLVRSIYAPMERGDFSRADWAHPEIECVMVGGPEPGSGSGLAAMATGWGEVLGAWEDFRVEVDDYREVDDERLLALIRFSGRGKTSGLEIATKGAALFPNGDNHNAILNPTGAAHRTASRTVHTKADSVAEVEKLL